MTDAQVDLAPEWAVTELGTGDPVVLVHGLGTDSSAWDRVAPALAEHHRVITVDLPGYSLRALTDRVPHATDLADGLDAVLAGAGVHSAVLVGHSFGGVVSLITANRHPDRCAGLVLLAPGGFGTELNPLLPLVSTRLGARMLSTLYGPRTSRAIERVAARVEARPGRDTRIRVSELMETYARLRTEQARAQFRLSVQETLALNSQADRQELAKVDRAIPILVLWGREDRVLPAWHAKNAATVFPWSVGHLIDGAGHTPHRSHPQRTSQEIRAFAESGAVRRRLSPAGS